MDRGYKSIFKRYSGALFSSCVDLGPAAFDGFPAAVAQRDAGKAVLLVSLELDEVMDVPDRILVMYEGEIVGELDPKTTTVQELGLYMAGDKRD